VYNRRLKINAMSAEVFLYDGATKKVNATMNSSVMVRRVKSETNDNERGATPAASAAAKPMPFEFFGKALLTPREIEVLALVANGASNKEAGRRLGISPRTIESHRAHIMHKVGARNAADLVRIVLGGGEPKRSAAANLVA